MTRVMRDITPGADSELLFLDQVSGFCTNSWIAIYCHPFKFIAVIKLLVEHAQGPADQVLNIDISHTLLALVGFIARFNNPECYRIKIKFSALCDSVCNKVDIFMPRKESTARHNILETVMEWIQDPATVRLAPFGSVLISD